MVLSRARDSSPTSSRNDGNEKYQWLLGWFVGALPTVQVPADAPINDQLIIPRISYCRLPAPSSCHLLVPARAVHDPDSEEGAVLSKQVSLHTDLPPGSSFAPPVHHRGAYSQLTYR